MKHLILDSGGGFAPGGTAGSLTWSLAGDTLTISGTGAMPDFSREAPSPWYGYSKKLRDVTVKVENGVTGIGDYAFYDCYGLTSVTIPDTVTAIGDYAFYDCRSLRSVTLPDTVKAIGEYAFAGCYILKEIHVEWSAPPRIPDNSFRGVHNGTPSTLHIPAGAQSRYKAAPVWQDFLILADSFSRPAGAGSFSRLLADLAPPAGAAGNLYWRISDGTPIVPGTLTVGGTGAMPDYSRDAPPWRDFRMSDVMIKNGITDIGNQAFRNCGLTSVFIPETVTAIGERVFEGCKRLFAIQVDTGNPVYVSNGDVLYSKDKTVLHIYPAGKSDRSFVIPATVTTIGEYAFKGCSRLTSVTLPDSVTAIGNEAFALCDSLTSVNIPDAVTTIGEYAFWGCNSLTSVTIPGLVTTIGDGTFQECHSLTSVTLPNSVTTIGLSAFFGCRGLTSVTLPHSVTEIRYGTFSGCRSLKDIHVGRAIPPDLYDYVFEEVDVASCTLHVPAGTEARYKAAAGWKDFGKIEEE